MFGQIEFMSYEFTGTHFTQRHDTELFPLKALEFENIGFIWKLRSEIKWSKTLTSRPKLCSPLDF